MKPISHQPAVPQAQADPPPSKAAACGKMPGGALSAIGRLCRAWRFLLLIALFVCIAPLLAFSPTITPDLGAMQMPPFFSDGHYFGTHSLGRDLLGAARRWADRCRSQWGWPVRWLAVLLGTVYGAVFGLFWAAKPIC